MSDLSVSPESKFSKSFAADYVEQTRVHLNFDQNVVITTEDRLELCLRNHLECISASRQWITPASLFAAFLTTLLTSDFRETFKVPAATWQAIFIILMIGCGIWSVVAAVNAFRQKSSLRGLLNEIKKDANVAGDAK